MWFDIPRDASRLPRALYEHSGGASAGAGAESVPGPAETGVPEPASAVAAREEPSPDRTGDEDAEDAPAFDDSYANWSVIEVPDHDARSVGVPAETPRLQEPSPAAVAAPFASAWRGFTTASDVPERRGEDREPGLAPRTAPAAAVKAPGREVLGGGLVTGGAARASETAKYRTSFALACVTLMCGLMGGAFV